MRLQRRLVLLCFFIDRSENLFRWPPIWVGGSTVLGSRNEKPSPCRLHGEGCGWLICTIAVQIEGCGSVSPQSCFFFSGLAAALFDRD